MACPRIAVIGCGLGGAAAAAALELHGIDVVVYEQAPAFSPVGAGIHLCPNLMKAMRFLGIEDDLLQIGFRPSSFTSRAFDTGEILFDLPLGDQGRHFYGADYLTIHRGDFHAALVSRIKPGRIQFGKQLSGISQSSHGVSLQFSDGTFADADLVIAADGVSSKVRQILFDPDPPQFSGQVAYRAVIDTAYLPSLSLDDLTKWWADDRFVIAYHLDAARKKYYFVAGFPSDWNSRASYVQGSREELLSKFSDFHPTVLAILESSPNFQKWPLFEREPNSSWHDGRVVMLGDACHPMRPHMAQGAAMAIEDAIILAHCIASVGPDHWEDAFKSYYDARIDRTSRIQEKSSQNTWLRQPENPDWVFKYDELDEFVLTSLNG